MQGFIEYYRSNMGKHILQKPEEIKEILWKMALCWEGFSRDFLDIWWELWEKRNV